MNSQTKNDATKARAALDNIQQRKVETAAELARAKKAAEPYRLGGFTPTVRLAVSLAERNCARVALEEHDARETLRDALFASELSENDLDAVTVHGLFDELTAAGDRAAALQAQLDGLYRDAAETVREAFEAHRRLNARRATAGDPPAPSLHANALTLVTFMHRVAPIDRTASNLRSTLGSTANVDSLPGSLSDKARALITGLRPSAEGETTRLQRAEKELFEAQRACMELERAAAEKKREEDSKRAERERQKRRRAEDAQAQAAKKESERRVAYEAERQAAREWSAQKGIDS